MGGASTSDPVHVSSGVSCTSGISTTFPKGVPVSCQTRLTRYFDAE